MSLIVASGAPCLPLASHRRRNSSATRDTGRCKWSPAHPLPASVSQIPVISLGADHLSADSSFWLGTLVHLFPPPAKTSRRRLSQRLFPAGSSSDGAAKHQQRITKQMVLLPVRSGLRLVLPLWRRSSLGLKPQNVCDNPRRKPRPAALSLPGNGWDRDRRSHPKLTKSADPPPRCASVIGRDDVL